MEKKKPASLREFRLAQMRIIKRLSAIIAPTEERTITFTNDDVPNFLKALDRFEKKARKVSLLVK